MSSDLLKPPDDNEHALGKLIGSCTAQLNWYATHPEKLYFAIRHQVLTELNDQLIDHYVTHKASDSETHERDRTYMTLYDWTSSQEFKDAMGDKYAFSDPYIVGSSWTPMRRADSLCDVVMSVWTENAVLPRIPEEVRDLFVRAFCKKFLVYESDEIYVRNNTIYFDVENFAISVRLTNICTTVPFAARLTSAINQYEHFLEGFSPLCFFIHSWCKSVRNGSRFTGKLAVPNSHTITLLLVHFLQYYEEIPHFFVKPEVENTSYLVENLPFCDILRNRWAAFHPNLLFNYQDFLQQRQGKTPTISELLTMFFYHYGYLVDFVNYQVSLPAKDFTMKIDTESVELAVVDPEQVHGQEVPDAYKFQFLCQEAFHIIKNTQNQRQTLERLLRMRIDDSFNAMRDRQMYLRSVTHSQFAEAHQNMPEHYRLAVNRTKPQEIDGFIYSRCGATEHWTVNPETVKTPENCEEFFSDRTFSDEMNMLRGTLQKPTEMSVDPKLPFPPTSSRTSKIFMTTTLPNPKNSAELLVLFRPPHQNKLRIVNDTSLEPFYPLQNVDDPWQPSRPRSFYGFVREGLLKEIAEQKKMEQMRMKFNENYEELEKRSASMWPTQSTAQVPETFSAPASTKTKKNGKKQKKKSTAANQEDQQPSGISRLIWERTRVLEQKKQECVRAMEMSRMGSEMEHLKNHEYQYEPDIKSGMISGKKLVEMYNKLRDSWTAELNAIITPNTEYTGFDYC